MDDKPTDLPEPASTSAPEARGVSPLWRAGAIVLVLVCIAGPILIAQQAANRRKQLSQAILGITNQAERLGDAAFRAPVERAPDAWDLALASLDAARALASQPDADPMWNDKVDSLEHEFEQARDKAVAREKLHAKNRRLVARLEQVRVPIVPDLHAEGWLDRDRRRIDEAYSRSFSEFGIELTQSGDELRARFSPAVATEVASALDHWAGVRRALGTSKSSVTPEALRAITTRIDGDHRRRSELRNALAKNAVDLDVLHRLHQDFDYEHAPIASARLLADALATAGDLDTAIACYEAALRSHPDDFVANVALGRLCERATPPRLGQAQTAYSAALALRPDSAATGRRLGIVLERVGQPAAALALFEHELETRPKDPELLHLVARSAHGAHKWNRAIVVYERLIRKKPDDPDLLIELGNVHRDKGDRSRAAAWYQRACKAKPDDRDAWQRLGNALAEGPDPKPAIAAFEKANAIEPQADTWIDMAVVQRKAEHTDKALASIANAIQLDSEADRAYSLRGSIRASRGDWQAAVASYRRAIDANPTNIDATLRAAQLLRDHGRYVDSLSLFRRVDNLGRRLGTAWTRPSGAWVREAEEQAKVERRLLPLIEGKGTAEFVSDWVAAIDYALEREAFAAVVSMFQRIVSTYPMIVNASDRPRAKAARAALLALAGKGTDTLADPAAARHLALSWLEAELEFWSKEIQREGIFKNRAQNTLESWTTSPDFAIVRGKAIDALPAKEAAGWRKFWDEVERLMRVE